MVCMLCARCCVRRHAGKLTIEEFARAFRALGLPKRDGSELEMDREMFNSFDTNGDGVCDLEEIEKGLNPKVCHFHAIRMPLVCHSQLACI